MMAQRTCSHCGAALNPPLKSIAVQRCPSCLKPIGYKATSPSGKSPLDHSTASKMIAFAAATKAEAPSATKAHLGPYRIEQEIGRGGMGVVLRAFDTMLNREVAVKVAMRDPHENELQIKRFLREAEVTGRLAHPGIVPIYARGKNPSGHEYFSMKLVVGLDLGELLKKWHGGDRSVRSEYPLPRLLAIFERICETIGYAHEQGVLHRDLKPDNVMIGDHGEVWVMDWGLAKVLNETDDDREAADRKPSSRRGATIDSALTMDDMVVGTPIFMAPEQSRGEEVDARADIYGLGGILYFILTGRAAVSGSTLDEVMARVAKGDVVPLSRLRRGKRIPKNLAAITARCMDVNPRRRYAGTKELLADLRAYQRDEPISALAETWLSSLRRWVRKHKLPMQIIGGAAGLLLLSAVAAAILVAHEAHSRLVAEQEKRAAEKIAAEKEVELRRQAELTRAAEAQSQKEVAARLRAELAAQRAAAIATERAQRRLAAFKPFSAGEDLLQRGQRFEDAEKNFREALRNDPEFPEAAFGLGESLRLQGLSKAAAEAYLNAAAAARKLDDRPFVKALLAASDAFQSCGEHRRGEEILERVAAVAEDDPLVWVGRAGMLSCRRKSSAAEALARRALAVAPHLWETHMTVGYVLWQNIYDGVLPSRGAALEEALRCLKRAGELAPMQATPLVLRAGILRCMDARANFDEIAALYEAAIRLEPRNGMRLINRCSFWVSQNNMDAFNRDLQEAQKLGAPDAWVQYAAAMAAAHQNRLPECFEILAKIIVSGKAWPTLSLNFIEIGLNLGRTKEVKALLEKAKEDCPNHPKLSYLEGRILLAEGKIREAAEMFRAAADTAPYFTRYRQMSVETFARATQIHEALSEARRGTADNPDDFGLRQTLVSLVVQTESPAIIARELEGAGKAFPEQKAVWDELKKRLKQAD
jgi:serine/threonine protein kinase